MLKYRKITDLTGKLKDTKVAIRIDANVPVQNGEVIDDSRLSEVLPTINFVLKEGARQIFLFSHFGRPDGEKKPEFSLIQVKERLEQLIGEKIEFCEPQNKDNAQSRVVLCENLRYYPEEESGNKSFAQMLTDNIDYYINDAFSASHRAHASISGISAFIKVYAGFLMEKEIESLQTIVSRETKNSFAIIGGSKVSTKIDLLFSLIKKMSYIFIGGGMANTFLYAQGYKVGNSLMEPSLKETALKILSAAQKEKCEIILPLDIVVCKKVEKGAPCRLSLPEEIMADEIIADVGNKTLLYLNSILSKCDFLLWNGPLGIYEVPPFNTSSFSFARDVALQTSNNKLTSVIGGGDTAAVILASGLKKQMSYISTGGGAFLEWLEGKELPGFTAVKY
jgi:phosphoglycerate kinase